MISFFPDNFFLFKFFAKASTDHLIFTYFIVLLTDEVVSACKVSSGQFYLTDTALKLYIFAPKELSICH